MDDVTKILALLAVTIAELTGERDQARAEAARLKLRVDELQPASASLQPTPTPV